MELMSFTYGLSISWNNFNLQFLLLEMICLKKQIIASIPRQLSNQLKDRPNRQTFSTCPSRQNKEEKYLQAMIIQNYIKPLGFIPISRIQIMDIIFIILIMAQKNHFQLNLIRLANKYDKTKTVAVSMINSKYSDTQRSQKFIPFEFRDKRSNVEKIHHFEHHLGNSSNCSFVNLTNRSIHQNGDFKAGELNLKSINTHKDLLKPPKKINTLKQVNTDMPKLRETNSTQCQSPKAESFQISKVSDFKKINLLGKGKFGDVYLVKHKKTGFVAALKIINKNDLFSGSNEQNQKAINQLIRQIKIQTFLNHPNLINLYDFFSDEDNFYLLLELACDGHLYELLERNTQFSEETTSIIVREIVEGVNYMHKHDIIHRDIKLENIVLTHGMAKICDFGWSVHCPKQFRSTLCGTPLYLSPQILVGKQYNKKIDIWAIGSLTHELYTAENPFKIKNKDELSKIVTQDFQMETGSIQLKSFITFTLKKNPSKRPDTDTLKRHPFITKYQDLQTSEELFRFNKKKSVKHFP